VLHDSHRYCRRDEQGPSGTFGGGSVVSLPPLLAKIATTLDHISNGRLILGLGAGWKREEYEAHGYPYPPNAERLAQMDECIKVIKAMWTQEEPTFHGRYFAIDKAYNYPRPLQKPHPPLMIGGSGSKLLKIAAAEADIININPPIFNGKNFSNDPSAAVKFDTAELKRRLQLLQVLTKEAGRDPNAIEISGLLVVSMSKDKSDAAVQATISGLGFTDQETARRAPVLLIGTPDEVRRELRSRIEEVGMTYYIVFPASEESHKLFAEEVMPEFAR
jgi:alkanesulfonate monooxygenase SsuD/methylene tetrahydromethanopterin reductase-like flavin-dependent oxidoreductase (luciferase family)